MIRFLKLLGGTLVTAALVACGGGGGSSGSNPSNPNPPPVVADFALFMDKTTIVNSGSDTAELTVVAVDANRNVVPNAPVTVTVDQNAVFAPAGTATDAAGSYTGMVGIGSDKRDRTITLTVKVNNIVKETAVRVAGTRITVEATPNTPSPGQAGVPISATVVDTSGNPIPNVSVTFAQVVSGTASVTITATPTVATTSLTGVATSKFDAPSTPGVYFLTATANGVTSAPYQVQVFASNVVPPATIPAGVSPSLSASPNVLSVNSPGTSANKSTLRFLFLNSLNQPIPNVRVRFDDQTVGLANVGASIASGTTTLYTDANGSVSTQYISGQNSSPTNGVTVRACYSAVNFLSPTDCPNFVTATLTVAGQALAVSVGDDNVLERGTGNITYIKRFAITVADSAGRAVANAPVDISVDLTHYGKGRFQYFYQDAFGGDVTDFLTVVPLDLDTAYPSMDTVPTALAQRVWCPNEDRNRNGSVDPGDNINGSVDSNNQPTLEPRKSDLLISYNDPTVTTTNASGVLVIKVEYAQRFATWLAYKLRVTANVQGSQGMAERLFVTDGLQDDVETGAFRTPPYGIGSCRQAN